MPIMFQKSWAQNNGRWAIPVSVCIQMHPNHTGLTYGDWTAKWWQWAYSVPRNVNPSYDDSGRYCSEGQNGPVWFLTRSHKHPVDRYCDHTCG